MTAGESHGPALVAVIEGLPAGLSIAAQQINEDLARRQKGYGRGGRMKIERDQVKILAGVRNGETLGSPVALEIDNRDFENWRGRMGPERFDAQPEAVTLPRPGHADLAGSLKYDRRDARDILERASARETAARTAAGAIARALLAAAGIEVCSRVRSIAGVIDEAAPTVDALFAARDSIEASELRVFSQDIEGPMRAAILARAHAGDTAGGTLEVVARGVLPGLGSHVQWDRRLDGRIAQAMLSVQAIKAVEIGDGWSAADLPGSAVHDPIDYDASRRRFVRASNHAGGIEGGMSNGEPIVVRAAMKPIATLRAQLPSADLQSKAPAPAAHERSDVCAVPAAGVVLEAALCLVLADALLEKHGGDSMGELLRNVERYKSQLDDY
ncbi:MAG: chorismate synthase [Myxococcales bacterium]|nr:chorismate synthase [Myxococcales bacterium]